VILEKWNQLSKIPGGKRMFSFFFGRMVPYSGSIHPEVLELSPGYAKVLVRDRKKIRNHLDSIHAAALMNTIEAASGLAFICGLPKDARAILVQFTIEYLKKARGNLTAECRCTPPATSEKSQHKIEAKILDENNVEVARGQATWLVSPAR
jgi:acyl-coenzyme A thioesterase PaaI-like protein